ncbi:PH domain-containing protein [Sandaracinus amylolyticus]|uniref:YdbS-like PH domain-containing protein n=1 Tax=Sandaracinus amylolyticus TaxID=927083 RepID=A0A0F6W078_9BACT|nr:PH domain-containing protein [Sandaracinus amylolyticus]AKF03927.1 hypothetical protein DB32_001076 [Sandaracinus amylolyticus]
MQRCPHCETDLPQPNPAICPSCGASLGEPPRRASGGDAAPPERVIFEGHPALVPGVLEALFVALTLGLGLVWLWVRSRGTHYRLTTSRVVIESGMLNKKIEQIDLYRVDDYAVDLPLGQRLLGTGNLTLATTDRSAKGEVRLAHLRTDVRALYEQLRAATEADKARRGVRRFDSV